MAGDRPGVMIIRAWIEKGSSEPLRAQIRLSTDVSDHAAFEHEFMFARPEEVCALVKEWLADILRDAEGPDCFPSERIPGWMILGRAGGGGGGEGSSAAGTPAPSGTMPGPNR